MTALVPTKVAGPSRAGASRTGPGRNRPSRDGPSWGRELSQTIFLAAPLAAAQIAQMLMALTDQVFMGRLGAESLAAGGLGTNLTFLLVVLSQGVLTAIGPLVAQARGAGATSGLSDSLAGGLVV